MSNQLHTYQRPRIVWGDGQVVSSVGFRSRIVAFADALSVWGRERKLYSRILSPATTQQITAFVTLIARYVRASSVEAFAHDACQLDATTDG